MLLPTPLRPAERSILFSGKSVRLFDDAQSAASSHAPKKGCGVREVWRSQTCTSGSPFFCLLFFSEAKKSKCPVGTRRMVTAALKANHKAQTHFQAAFVTSKPASLPHPSAHQWRVGGSPTSLLTSRTLFNQPFGNEPSPLHRQPETQTQPIQTNKRQPENTISRFQAAFLF